jgi:hypothetical protein
MDLDLNKVRNVVYGADYGRIIFNDGTSQTVTLKEAYDTARAIRKMRTPPGDKFSYLHNHSG